MRLTDAAIAIPFGQLDPTGFELHHHRSQTDEAVSDWRHLDSASHLPLQPECVVPAVAAR